MLKFAEENLLGHGTPIDKGIVRLIRSLGPESEHVLALTDPAAARKERIESRREWPDSPMSDVPDRYPLFHLLGDVDMMVWPELGTAVDQAGRVAAHLRDAGQWILVGEATIGEVVIKQLPSGGHIARAITPATGTGFPFAGPKRFLEAVGRASARIAALHAQAHERQDRGG